MRLIVSCTQDCRWQGCSLTLTAEPPVEAWLTCDVMMACKLMGCRLHLAKLFRF